MRHTRSIIPPFRPAFVRFGYFFIAVLLLATSSSVIAQSNPSGTINTIAGNGSSGYSGDGGSATNAQLGQPQDVALDSAGNLYIADAPNNVIRKLVVSTGIITTVAGNGTAGYSGDGSVATGAELNYPDGVAVDSAGNIYISDLNNNVVRKVTASSGIITTVAGSGSTDYVGDGGPATSAGLSGPSDLKVDSAGNIYIADTFNNAVRKVTASTGIISTVAGDGDFAYYGDGGQATEAGVTTPQYIALDSAGNLYISSWWDCAIRKVTASTGIISTVAGNGVSGYTGDGGPATSAEITWTSVASDSAGNLYFADSGNNVIRKVNASTGIITTIAGNGSLGYSGDGGAASAAELHYPFTAIVDPTGNLYIADTYNNRIRAVGPAAPIPTFSPQPGSYTSTQTVTIGDSFVGSQIFYTTDGSTPTTLSNLYSGALSVASSTTLKAIATGAGYGNSAVATAAYAIGSSVNVQVNPSTATLSAGQTQQFSATVTNSSNTSVIWSINPVGVGTIDSGGIFTAPATVTSQQTVTVTATSQADPTKSASAVVTLRPTCQANGYSYVRPVVIDHTKVPNTDQVNFPFLFSTTDSALATTANAGHVANPNGYDIVFTSDPAGLHRLSHEVEEYEPTTGKLIAWVNLPLLSHTADTTLYLWYGNSAISTPQQTPSSVWDSDFVGVWHLPNGTLLSASDSTGYGNNGTDFGAAATSGQIDGGALFNGTNSSIALGTNITTSQMNTVSTWAYINTLSRDQEMVSHSGNGSGVELLIFGGNLCAYVMGNSQSNICGTAGLNVPGWNHIVLTQGGPSAPMTLYINGAVFGQTTTPSSIANPPQLYFGVWANSAGRFFNGKLDEGQISTTARSADLVATSYNNQSSPSTFYSLNPESSFPIVPGSVQLYASGSQQFLAYPPGSCSTAAVAWSAAPAGLGMLTADGLYTAPASIASEPRVTITATDAATQRTATAVVTLLPVANPSLELAATGQPPYVVGSTQLFSAVLKNRDGTPISNSSVTFTVAGPNSTSGASTTDSTGTAIFSYAGANSGVDTIQATFQSGGTQVQSNQLSVSWIIPVQPISSSTLTGEFFFSNGSCSFNIPPTTTPAWTQTFPSINFNPVGVTIPGLPRINWGGQRPFTDVTTDINGNYTGTIIAEGNGYQAGVDTSTYSMNAFQAVFRGTFTIKAPGNMAFNFFSDDGFIFGVGNGASRVSGSTVNMPALTPFGQYPAVGAYNSGAAGEGNVIVVNFPAAGTYPYEVDYTECDGGGLTFTMAQGATSATGIPPTGSLTMTPNSASAQPIGGQETFAVVATSADGTVVPNLKVSLVVSGANNLNVPAVTDSSGRASFSYRDTNGGTDFVQVVATIDGMVSYSNIVVVPWTSGASTPPINNNGDGSTLSIAVTAQNTVLLPSTLQLSSSVTDSALQAGGTIALSWSQVSGPGAVSFSSPNTAATTAAFTLPGAYALRLSATDSDASDSVTFNITVDPQPGTAQGWIGSPMNGTTVSGIVPITVASGETLQSGTLTYYPATNESAVTVLNSNTTGSGQIGTFDATSLANGQYWITLQAIDSNGKSSYNLALVTVTGNYKPGRVTSTVTDLVVPSNGLAIQIQRTYDSLNANASGDFGFGWNLSTSVQLTVNPFGSVTFTIGGQRKTFYLTPQILGWFLPYYTPVFTAEPGLHGTLAPAGSGCPDLFDFLVPDGSLWACVGGGFYTPPGYVYTDPSGTAYAMTASGQLQSIVDKNGNTLDLTPSGISSSTGLSVPFQRDSKGRITQITDPLGNIYQYGYLDAGGQDNGNLQTVQYPNTSRASTYSYDSHHLYLTGTDSLGNSLPTTDYYQSTFDPTGKCQTDCDPNGLPLTGRLKSVTTSPGSGVTYTTGYSYSLSSTAISSPPNPNAVIGTTTVTYPQDANGNVGTATMGYNNYGDLVTSTDAMGFTTTNTYDSNRNLLSTTDPLQNTTSYTYDANGNRTSTTYPNPQPPAVTNTTSRTTYNQYSEPVQTVDELGNARAFNYDVNFNPQSVTDALGTLASFTFGTDGTMRSGAVGYDLSIQPSMQSTFTYDQDGNLAGRTDALGRTTSYQYNSLGQRTQMTAPPQAPGQTGAATNYQYDPLGNLTETDAPLSRTTKSAYDANSNKTSDTDGNGKTTSYQYDGLNRLVETDYPDSTSTHRSYDFRGNAVDEKDQNGNLTHHVYDLDGRETSVISAFGSPNAVVTAYTYDNDGRKLSETVGSGTLSASTTNYTYDPAGNLTGASGPGGTFTYAYDNARNRISVTDGRGNKTRYQYDTRKRLIETDYPDGTKQIQGYDGPGNLVTVTDQAGKTIQYTYDAANQLRSVVQLNAPDSSHNTTSYAYDGEGNLTGLTDANGHATSNAFDLLSELGSKTLPDGSLTESRTYDLAGNLYSLTHFSGKTTTYSYDNENRLLRRTPDSTLNEPTVSFTYTPTGKRATMTDASGTTTYSYDSVDRLTSKATPEGTLNYTYDSAGNLASMRSVDGYVSVSYTWDSLRRLSTVVDNRLSGQNTTTYTYDSANDIATVTYPNGFHSMFSYDNLNRLTSLTASSNGYQYQLGPTGIRANTTESTGRSVTWSYDGLYRLTNEAIGSDPAGENGSVGYGLDPVGNRLSSNSTLSGISSSSTSFDADDRLSTETYDLNGNVTNTGGKAFAYDSEGRLVSMNAGALVLLYDGDGNRVAKAVNGATTRYLVDDLNPTGYPQVVEESVNGVAQRAYAYGLQRIDENQVISNVWTPSFYGYDGMGNVRQLTNASGATTDSYEYDAFGNTINSSGTTPNDYLYRGEQYDSDLGGYYLRARYYNTITGRFLSRDPERGRIDDPITMHRYLYAADDSVNRVDPTGRDEIEYSEVNLRISASENTIESLHELRSAINCALVFIGSSAFAEVIGGPRAVLIPLPGCIVVPLAFSKNDDSYPLAPPYPITDTDWPQKKFDRCKQMEDDVQKAKRAAQGLGRCVQGMSSADLQTRLDAWTDLLRKRTRLHDECFGGEPDKGHRDQVQQNLSTALTCAALLK